MLAIVHNGVIENYRPLKARLEENGFGSKGHYQEFHCVLSLCVEKEVSGQVGLTLLLCVL